MKKKKKNQKTVNTRLSQLMSSNGTEAWKLPKKKTRINYKN